MSAALKRPAIFLTSSDAERLKSVACRARNKSDEAAALLAEELDRAHVCSPDEMPARVVRIGSRVRYRDLQSREAAEARIVMPSDASQEEGAISVLDVTGAALIGVPQDQCFRWRDRDGKLRGVEVVEVLDDYLWK